MESETIFTSSLPLKVKEHLPLKAPVFPYLLAFSGGSDSTALAHALLEIGIPFHLAHFDHGMREESGEEAEFLSSWAKEKGIPFIAERSSIFLKTECAAREGRYRFLSRIFRRGKYEALLTAHHQSDLAETVLKRCLEGASLSALGAMEARTLLDGEIPLLRPLISLPKEEITSYLSEKKVAYFDDPTNRDPKFLRSRMRISLIPQLSKEFGKEVIAPLCRLGEEGQKLRGYLDRRVEKFSDVKVVGPMGFFIDFRPFFPLESVEVDHFIKKHLPGVGRALLTTIFDLLSSGLADKQLFFQHRQIAIDRGRLFFFRRELPIFPEGIAPLKGGVISSGSWRWEISIVDLRKKETEGWIDWWRGEIDISIPEDAVLKGGSQKELKKKRSQKHIPAFLWKTIPHGEDQQERVYDPLQRRGLEGETGLRIALKGSPLLP